MPSLQLGLAPAASPAQTASAVQILLLITALTLAPAMLILMTSFTRIVVVLSFVRNALALNQTPPNQVLIGLALFLTLFVMAPTFNQIRRDAWTPYQAGQISQTVALDRAEAPLRTFMLKQTQPQDLQLFLNIAGQKPKAPADVSLTSLIPAFVISELRTAFEIGFVLFLPFVVIDLVVATTMMSMGMMMVPPMMVSLPFKILLFVLVDGWHLIVQSLLISFH